MAKEKPEIKDISELDIDSFLSIESDLDNDLPNVEKKDVEDIITSNNDNINKGLDEIESSFSKLNVNKVTKSDEPQESTNGDQLKESDEKNLTRNLDILHSLPVDISVILGKTELVISDLLLMGQGSVIELDKLIGDDLDVFVNGRPIAQGTIVLSNNNFGCKVNRILTPIERLRKLVMDN